ncbi:MAG: glycosyltransferase family 2 protein, partial [Spirochaetes bacterium]
MIVPCRNEEAFIGEGLNSLIAQNYSKDSLEVLLADGMSKDNAQNILQSSTEK